MIKISIRSALCVGIMSLLSQHCYAHEHCSYFDGFYVGGSFGVGAQVTKRHINTNLTEASIGGIAIENFKLLDKDTIGAFGIEGSVRLGYAHVTENNWYGSLRYEFSAAKRKEHFNATTQGNFTIVEGSTPVPLFTNNFNETLSLNERHNQGIMFEGGHTMCEKSVAYGIVGVKWAHFALSGKSDIAALLLNILPLFNETGPVACCVQKNKIGATIGAGWGYAFNEHVQLRLESTYTHYSPLCFSCNSSVVEYKPQSLDTLLTLIWRW